MSAREIVAIRLERSFAGTPEEVFDAWTSPEVLTRWWAAQPTWSSPGCEVDLRVGGRYTLRMRDDDGRVYAVGGEYREVDRPRRLVYTWCWQGTDGPDPGVVSLVTVEFLPETDGTTVVLEHSGLLSEQSRTGHESGWIGVLENLARRIFDAHERI
jgi:uncharacterized protein YndB with AHSA1/START domain